MADKYYAWSPIQYDVERDDQGNALGPKRIEVGEQVTASNLGLTDKQFQELVDGGAVRTTEFPKELQDPDRSPVQKMFEIHNLREGQISGGYFTPDAISQLQAAADAGPGQSEEIEANKEGKVTDVRTGKTSTAGS